jgi:hypothetical protein
MARPPERYDPAAISPPGPYDRVKLIAYPGDRNKTRLVIFEGWHMHRVSTVKDQPRIPKIEIVLFQVRLSFCFVPFEHSIL